MTGIEAAATESVPMARPRLTVWYGSRTVRSMPGVCRAETEAEMDEQLSGRGRAVAEGLVGREFHTAAIEARVRAAVEHQATASPKVLQEQLREEACRAIYEGNWPAPDWCQDVFIGLAYTFARARCRAGGNGTFEADDVASDVVEWVLRRRSQGERVKVRETAVGLLRVSVRNRCFRALACDAVRATRHRPLPESGEKNEPEDRGEAPSPAADLMAALAHITQKFLGDRPGRPPAADRQWQLHTWRTQFVWQRLAEASNGAATPPTALIQLPTGCPEPHDKESWVDATVVLRSAGDLEKVPSAGDPKEERHRAHQEISAYRKAVRADAATAISRAPSDAVACEIRDALDLFIRICRDFDQSASSSQEAP